MSFIPCHKGWGYFGLKNVNLYLQILKTMKTLDEVKKRIEVLGIKKKHVATKIGVTPVELSHFLSGRRDLGFDARKKLIDYLF